MTIGIGAYGPFAGAAVFEALRAAELIGRGAIGGFATFAAISVDGQLLRYETQRGGSQTLFTEGERTGVEPPESVQNAIAAGVISSGPDRPTPLSQFLAADPDVGLVTGHRLPNTVGAEGIAINRAVLEQIRQGSSAQEAVQQILANNAQVDVGLIGVDLDGGVYAQNSERVAQRPDLGYASRSHSETGARVEVIHNAIRPFPTVAIVAADVALERMRGEPQPRGWVTIPTGIPVVLGRENWVEVNEQGVATLLVTTDPILVKGHQVGAGIYLNSQVKCKDQLLGRTLFEPICTIDNGRLIEMSGQQQISMSYR